MAAKEISIHSDILCNVYENVFERCCAAALSAFVMLHIIIIMQNNNMQEMHKKKKKNNVIKSNHYYHASCIDYWVLIIDYYAKIWLCALWRCKLCTFHRYKMMIFTLCDNNDSHTQHKTCLLSEENFSDLGFALLFVNFSQLIKWVQRFFLLLQTKHSIHWLFPASQ